MKLATYRDGSRDGQLVVVSRDLRSAHYATGAAHTLQQVLDDWNFIAPQLQDLYVALNQGRVRHAFPFESSRCMAPLPRAFQWLAADGSQTARADRLPCLRQGSGDAIAGPHADISLHDEALAADFGAGLAVITGDLPARARPEQALEAIRLLMLSNDWHLRALEAGSGCEGAVQARPVTAFGPLALTPDELGAAWTRGRLEAAVRIELNGSRIGLCATGTSPWDFGQLLSLASRTRPLGAGTVLGETFRESGQPSALHELCWGDRIRIEILGRDGQSLFGAIDQVLSPAD